MSIASANVPFGTLISNARAEAVFPQKLKGQSGSSDVMHALRDGTFSLPNVTSDREIYDMVVVGGGLSGLAAAYHFLKSAPAGATVLVLEAQNAIGGHAARNEFIVNGRKLVAPAGSQMLVQPSFFGPVVMRTLNDLGIDLNQLGASFDQAWAQRHGLATGIFFRKEHYGQDQLVIANGATADWITKAPLDDLSKADLTRLIYEEIDYLPDLTPDEKGELLASISYAQFLRDHAKVAEEVVEYLQDSTKLFLSADASVVSALDASAIYCPGFKGINVGNSVLSRLSATARLLSSGTDPYIYMFPDGLHGLARAFVRALVPAAVPGTDLPSLMDVELDASTMDDPESPVRIKLGATVVSVSNTSTSGTGDGQGVEIVYVRHQEAFRVSARYAVLACWNRVVPHICREVGLQQRAALEDQVRIPLVYANVALSNWKAFKRLGVSGFSVPRGFWQSVNLSPPVSMGSFQYPGAAEEPAIVGLLRVASEPATLARDQSTLGRYGLQELTYGDLEAELVDLLSKALGPGGFDPLVHIKAITINVWGHGYAYEYMSREDSFWPYGELPIWRARRKINNIAIASSDSGAYAYAHGAIEQGIRSVAELLNQGEVLSSISRRPGPAL
jgi:spermidine dehydrogenase